MSDPIDRQSAVMDRTRVQVSDCETTTDPFADRRRLYDHDWRQRGALRRRSVEVQIRIDELAGIEPMLYGKLVPDEVQVRVQATNQGRPKSLDNCP